MKYNKISKPSYNIHVIETDKFKTVTVKINFKRKIKREDITYRNMLVNILCESTSDYPTKRLMEVATEDLYDLSYQGSNYISGRYSVMGFDITFLNEKYTEAGMLEKSVDFLASMIFRPNVEHKKFNQKAFNMSYNVLENNIKSLKENPSLYSRIRMLEYMDPDTVTSYRSSGYLEDLEKIDAKKLYKYYEKVLSSDIVDIFVIGDIKSNLVEHIIEEKINIKTMKKPSESHFIESKNRRLLPKTFKEKTSFSQSQLVMGLKMNKLSMFELRYVLNVYSYILGGGPDSKLFKNVREKNSLCYSISSSGQPLNSILTISAGINVSDFNKAVSLIKKELRKMIKGDFSNEDIMKAKVTYMNGLRELEDNPQNLISLYAGMEYLDSDDIDKRINNINKVSKSDIISLSSKVHLDTIYLLEGGDTSEEK